MWYPPQPPAGSVPGQKSGFLKGALIVLGAFVLFIAFLVLVIAFLGSPAEDTGPEAFGHEPRRGVGD